MDKRGIAPLIATMLLISFAVSLGMVVMNFGRAQVELQAQCAIDINMKISEIAGKQEVCLDAAKQELKFTIENGVNIKVEGLLVNIIGSERAETFELDDAKMTKSGIYLGRVPYDASASGTIRQIRFTPKVILYDTVEVCAEKSLIFENIGVC